MLKHGIGMASAVLATVFAAGAANAQTSYVSIGTGYTQLDSADTLIKNGIAPNSDMDLLFKVDEDYNLRAAYGVEVSGFRFEGEFGYGNFDVAGYESRRPVNVQSSSSGSVGLMTAMANAYYDFGAPGGMRPYLGAGLGAMRAEFEASAPLPTAPNGAIVEIINDDTINLGWQAMAGLSFPMGGNLTLTAQYRFFDGGTFNYTGFAGHAANVELKGSSLDAGLRVGF